MRQMMMLVGAVMLVAAAATVYAKDEKAAPKDAAKPAPAAPAPAAGKGAPAAPAAPVAKKPVEAEPMAMPPTPHATLIAQGKVMTGTWKCAGTVNADSGPRPSVGTVKVKVDLDKFWIHVSMEETKTKENPTPYKFEAYRTFDGKKWHEVSVDNMGGWGHAWSSGIVDGKASWESEASYGDMKMLGKGTESWPSPKEWLMAGQGSMDGGKTYHPSYDIVCKK